MITPTLSWIAPTGENLTFQAYPRYADWHDKPGLYMFCKPGGLMMPWQPLYIGKADSFRDRFCNHERWDEAARLGASHVLAVGVGLEYDRTRFEDALVKHFNPTLNVQLRPKVNPLAVAALRHSAMPRPTTILDVAQGLGLGAVRPPLTPVPNILGTTIGAIKRK